jgi:hypothetical protein
MRLLDSSPLELKTSAFQLKCDFVSEQRPEIPRVRPIRCQIDGRTWDLTRLTPLKNKRIAGYV